MDFICQSGYEYLYLVSLRAIMTFFKLKKNIVKNRISYRNTNGKLTRNKFTVNVGNMSQKYHGHWKV